MKRFAACLALMAIGSASSQSAPAMGPLRVHPENPRYFTDGTMNGKGGLKAVYLTGSHNWYNLQDAGKIGNGNRWQHR